MKVAETNFWDQLYINKDTNWDVGTISTPLKEYIDQLEDKNLRILIPGCGNAYEAAYLNELGFTDVTLIDISKTLVERITKVFEGSPNIRIILGDFFEHTDQYELILEQTFFCALDPTLREKYLQKMAALLKPGGKLAGLLFNKIFDKEGPPFGGSKKEYLDLFSKYLQIKTIETCYNSIAPRLGNELFIIASKR